MKAVVWTHAGPPEVLQLQEVEKPAPKANEVLIKIHATSATAGDCGLRKSNTPRLFKLFGVTAPGPLILGQELAGEIEAIGAAVTRCQPGAQVVAWTGLRLGTYAQYICLSEKAVMAIQPPTMTYAEAAPLAVGGLDAAYFMRSAHIQPAERVLIIGAGGSMGTYAVQMAKALGAHVTGVDSSGKLEMLRAIGADQVIDYAQQDFRRSGAMYDVIFDVISEGGYARNTALLTSGGRYLLANPHTFDMLRERWLRLRHADKRLIPWAIRSAGQYAEDFAFLKGLIAGGKIKTVIDRVYPLEEVAAAHRYVETGQKKGQVILSVAHEA
ncbi:MAG: NAD(P)-dependent alcohol dehydrogenase [Chloroflexi bacterium]|nr:NAD(P)-dependent alcohol dehydrogenase [Chloroflexota bacterium]